jgi:hypothetical protein
VPVERFSVMWIAATLIATSLLWQIPLDQGVGFGNAVVSGTVRENRYTLPNTIVYATSETSVASTVTDENGRFYFLTLLPGTYRLTASKPGYIMSSCVGPPDEPRQLAAGLEYTITIWLASSCK